MSTFATRIFELKRSKGAKSTPAILPAASVRRALFGRPTKEETATITINERHQAAEASKLKWEYDFVNDKPLNLPNGRFVYEKCQVRVQALPPRTRPAPAHAHAPASCSGSATAAPVSPRVQMVQSRITDYMQARKRPASGQCQCSQSSGGPPSKKSRPMN